MAPPENSLLDRLQEIKYADDNHFRTLRQRVITYILETYENDEEVLNFLKDLSEHGCQSGMVNDLIYYKDTHDFYDTYYGAIEGLREELEEVLGEPLQPRGDLKNWYAWLAFEETASRLAAELGLF